MSRAFCLLRQAPHYRKDAFDAGLKAAGYELATAGANRAATGDVVVIWNRYGANEQLANQAEAGGATVLVVENGYCGQDETGHQLYAIAKHGHNGSGTWRAGADTRWDSLGIEIAPWRESGEHILVCGQRGIGSRTMASPADWHNTMLRKLRGITRRPIVVRQHPGNNPDPKRPSLEAQLQDCWAVVVWSSTSGVQALIRGIPVFYDAPHFICAGAASREIQQIDAPPCLDRLQALRRMAWAQWNLSEIQAGTPFRHLQAA